MKETKFLGTLLPSSPDLFPIVEAVREKYGLHEVRPEDEPIKEFYLDGRLISVEELRQDVGERLRDSLSFFSPATVKQYKAVKMLNEFQKWEGLEALPQEYVTEIEALLNLSKTISAPILQGLEGFIDSITNMLCFYMLTGEAGEIPLDWVSKVMTISSDGETAIWIMANQLADPEEIIEKFRKEYKKNFGVYRPKMTDNVVSTAYYLQLKRQRYSWKYIVDEFIRLEKISMPWKENSRRYIDIRHKVEQLLKKRMQRTEKIWDTLLGDKK